jgi:hypothetical protein
LSATTIVVINLDGNMYVLHMPYFGSNMGHILSFHLYLAQKKTSKMLEVSIKCLYCNLTHKGILYKIQNLVNPMEQQIILKHITKALDKKDLLLTAELQPRWTMMCNHDEVVGYYIGEIWIINKL